MLNFRLLAFLAINNFLLLCFNGLLLGRFLFLLFCLFGGRSLFLSFLSLLAFLNLILGFALNYLMWDFLFLFWNFSFELFD